MIISFVFAFISIFITYLCSGSFASFLMAGTTFVLGQTFCNIVQRENRDKAKILFNVVFSSLTIFACIHYMDTVVDWKTFAVDWRDEYKFWLITEETKYSQNIATLFNEIFIDELYYKNHGYLFYISTLSYLAHNYFDGNSLLLQFLGSGLFGSLSCVILYKIMLLYFDKRKALGRTLIFSLCSAVLVYSFNFIRDIHIYFFFLLNTYILLSKFEIKKLVIMVISCALIFTLRFESGVISILFPAFYLYNKSRKNVILLMLLFLFGGIIFFAYFFKNVIIAMDNMNFYDDLTDRVLSEADGITNVLAGLPTPLKEIGLFLVWLIKPFPPYLSLVQSTNGYATIIAILVIIYQCFNFFILILAGKWMIVDKAYKRFSFELKLVLIIALILIILNLHSITIRRVLLVYPIIYLAYCLIKDEMPKNVVNKNKWALFGVYAVGIITYMILKA